LALCPSNWNQKNSSPNKYPTMSLFYPIISLSYPYYIPLYKKPPTVRP
jgi:hypothetical protein